MLKVIYLYGNTVLWFKCEFFDEIEVKFEVLFTEDGMLKLVLYANIEDDEYFVLGYLITTYLLANSLAAFVNLV